VVCPCPTNGRSVAAESGEPGDDPVPAALAALVEILAQFPDLPVLESTGQLKGRAQWEFPAMRANGGDAR
jgi:hypothetical protein